MNSEQIEQLKVARHRAKTDHLFLANLLGYDFVPEVHKPLFDTFVQKQPGKPLAEQDTIKNRLILWPRGCFKTTADIVDCVQWLLLDPNIRLLLVSGKYDLAKDILKSVKQHFISNENLLTLFPEYRLDPKKAGTTKEFTVPCRTNSNLKEPSLSITSASAVRAGYHCDVLKIDDLVHEKNIGTKEQLNNSIDALNYFAPLVDPGGYTDVIGTRYAEGDAYGWLLSQRKWTDLPTPFGVDLLSKDGTAKATLRRAWKSGTDGCTLLFPRSQTKSGKWIGLTVEELKAKEAANPYIFSCQYLNSPVAGALQTFPEDLILKQTVPVAHLPKWGPVFITFDLGFSVNKQADFTVAVVGRFDRTGRLYIIDLRVGRFTPHELVQHIFDLTLKHRPVRIGIEDAAGSHLLSPALDALARDLGTQLPLDWLKVKNTKHSKNERIAGLESLLRQGKLFFAAGLPDFDKLIQQFTRWPKATHDDVPDAISLLLNYQNASLMSVPNYALDTKEIEFHPDTYVLGGLNG